MYQVCQFLKENVDPQLLCPVTSSGGRFFVRLQEHDPSAAVSYFDLFVPSGKKTDFYVFKLPDNLEFKKIFPEYNCSCDFILFQPSDKIVMLIELKGASLAHAKKQLKYSEPLISYILRLAEIERKRISSKYTIKRVIISFNKHRRPNINLENGYVKENRDGYTILRVPRSQCRYEWDHLV